MSDVIISKSCPSAGKNTLIFEISKNPTIDDTNKHSLLFVLKFCSGDRIDKFLSFTAKDTAFIRNSIKLMNETLDEYEKIPQTEEDGRKIDMELK